MRKLHLSAAAVYLSIFSSITANANPSAEHRPDYVPDVLLVKISDLKQDKAASKGLIALGAREIRPLLRTTKQPVNSPLARWREVTFGKGVDIQKMIEKLSKNPIFESVQVNHLVKFSTIPNDARYSEQWGLPKINAPSAWDMTTGSPDVVVGVIDTGIDFSHPDLEANKWVNPGEIPGNGIDDDSNGYIDDINGYDFGNNDSDPTDYYNHGTHVAGTIAAVGNNSEGITGVSWNSKLMAVKVSDDAGYATEAKIVNGIYYASVNGAFVTNNSYGLIIPGGVQPYGSDASYDAVLDAYYNQVLFVAAAGNERGIYSWADRSNVGFPQIFPTYPLENIIVVAASDQSDNLADFSNYGSLVHLAAPGVDILSTIPRTKGKEYITQSGTSMATPHVVGTAALVKSLYPNMHFLDVKHRIVNNVDHVGDLEVMKLISGGRLNSSDALSAAPVATTINWATPPVSPIEAGVMQPLTVYIEPSSGGALQCDPKIGGCAPGSYGKVRVWNRDALVSVDPFQSRMSTGYFDIDVTYNGATGRYEAGWDSYLFTTPSRTYKVEYLGTSVNSPALTSTQMEMVARPSATNWVSPPPASLSVNTTHTLKVELTPSDGGDFNGMPYGNVRFMDGTTVLGEVAIERTLGPWDGEKYLFFYFATLEWSPTTTGSHVINAQYLGYTFTNLYTGETFQVVEPSSAQPVTTEVTGP